MDRSEIVRQYLQALDLDGRKLDIRFLSDLTARHVAAFAFCNVGCLLGDDLPLDFESLFQRIVVQRRGGYCFEQNGLLYAVLDELGFSPKLVMARVIFNQNPDPGLTHRVTIVEVNDRHYVLDVGFGAHGLRIPVPMSEIETYDRGRVFRITELQPGEYHMQVFMDGEALSLKKPLSLYRFEFGRYDQVDCEISHFYTSRHPKSNFLNHPIASRHQDDEIRSLRDLDYWVIRESGKLTQEIKDSDHLRGILVGELGVQVKEAECRQLYEFLKR
jgi:N-hydroxyarylamine O-acetyltransferase